MRQALRWLCGGLIGLALLVSIGLVGGFFWLRQSLPVVDGTIEVQALGAPVEIMRDAHAVSARRAPALRICGPIPWSCSRPMPPGSTRILRPAAAPCRSSF